VFEPCFAISLFSGLDIGVPLASLETPDVGLVVQMAGRPLLVHAGMLAGAAARGVASLHNQEYALTVALGMLDSRFAQARRGRMHDVCITMVRNASPPGPGGNGKCRVSRGSEQSPDSEPVRRALSKSGLASGFGPQKCDFTSRGGGPPPESFRCRLESDVVATRGTNYA
jgi:hypothetical protein